MNNTKLFCRADDIANEATKIEEIINDMVKEIEDLEEDAEKKDDYITTLEEDIQNLKSEIEELKSGAVEG